MHLGLSICHVITVYSNNKNADQAWCDGKPESIVYDQESINQLGSKKKKRIGNDAFIKPTDKRAQLKLSNKNNQLRMHFKKFS